MSGPAPAVGSRSRKLNRPVLARCGSAALYDPVMLDPELLERITARRGTG